MEWHAQLHPQERRQVVQRVVAALKQAQPNYSAQQIGTVAHNFEKHLHSTATSKEDYYVICRARLQVMEQKARMGPALNPGLGMQMPNQQAGAQVPPNMTLQYDPQQQQQNQHVNMQAMMAQAQRAQSNVGGQQLMNMPPTGQQQADPRALMTQQQAMMQRGTQQSPAMGGQQKQPMVTLNQPMGNLVGSPYQQLSATGTMPQQQMPNSGQRQQAFDHVNNGAMQQQGGLSISNPNGVPNAAQMQQIHRMLQAVQNFRAQMGYPLLEPEHTTPPQVMKLYQVMKAYEARQMQVTQQAQAQAGQASMQLHQASMPVNHMNTPLAHAQQSQQKSMGVPQQNNMTPQQMQQMQATIRAQMQNQQMQQHQQQQLEQQQQHQHQQQHQQHQQHQPQQQQQLKHPQQMPGGPQRRPQAQLNQTGGPANLPPRTDASNPFSQSIPPSLLSKMPFLPPGVTSWLSVMDLGKKKLLSPQQIDCVRQVYSIHQRMVASQMAAQSQAPQNNNTTVRPPQQQEHGFVMPQSQLLPQAQQHSFPTNGSHPSMNNTGQQQQTLGVYPGKTTQAQATRPQTAQPIPKRKIDTAAIQSHAQEQGSPSKRPKVTTQSADATLPPSLPQHAQQATGPEKSHMMQLLLKSCPVEEQGRLRLEASQLEEQIANRQRNHAFKNLSEQEKIEVRQQVAIMMPYCARVDQLTTIYYIVSRNAQAVRQLLEMKYLFQDHLRWIRQGQYVLDAKDLTKLKVNCDKMFASVKEHLTAVARAVQSKAMAPEQLASPAAEALAATFNKGLKPEDLKLPATRKKMTPKDDTPRKNTPEQQAEKLKEENAKIAARAEALVKKEAEADPLAWALKQVDAFYKSPTIKTSIALSKNSLSTPSTILKTPQPLVAANTPNTLAKQLINSGSVTNGSALPPTPPRSDRIPSRVLGDGILEDESGLFELFLNEEPDETSTTKPRSGAELLSEFEVDDNVNYWSMRLTPLTAA